MKPALTLTHKFVEFVPESPAPNILYISIPYATAVHRCCCGCGLEVVTPFSPADWKLIFDGKTVSLEPSIGNWGFLCQSHYWIRKNQVCWADKWSETKIDTVRNLERATKRSVFAAKSAADRNGAGDPEDQGLWQKLKRKVRRSPGRGTRGQ
jgi:hypothetical protein